MEMPRHTDINNKQNGETIRSAHTSIILGV